VGGGGDDVVEPADLDDVGSVAAAGALGVVGVDGAVPEGGNGVLDKAALVEGVGVDHHLHVEGIGDAQAVVDGGGGGAPVLVQLQAGGAGEDHLLERRGNRSIALAGEREVHRKAVEALDHAPDVPGARAGGGKGAVG